MAIDGRTSGRIGRREFIERAVLTGVGLSLSGHARTAHGQPKRGGVMAMATYTDPSTWDPHPASQDGIQASSQFYNQLVEFDPSNPTKIIGDLAASWQRSENGSVYTFKLQEHAKWWDGRPVTAEDVVFSLARMKERGSARAKLWLTFADSWEAVDPLTIRINLKSATAAFLPFLAIDLVKILPKHVAANGDITKPENIVGSGPFKFVKWTKGDSYEVMRNSTYFKAGRPYLDGIRHFVIRDKGTLVAAFKAERVLMQNASFSGLSTHDYAALRQDPKSNLMVHTLPFPSSNWGIFLNVRQKPLDDPRIRKAMHLATDRQEMIKIFSADGVALLGAPFPPGTWYGHSVEEMKAVPGYRQPKDADIAEAKNLLAAAGMPRGFKTSIVVRTIGVIPDMASVWKTQMKRIGVDVEVRALESSAGLAAYAQANFDIGLTSSGIVVDEPEAVIGDAFREGALRNYGGWLNPDVERLVVKQRAELDQRRRAQVLRELEDELLSWRNNYWIGLFWEPDQWIVNRKVGGFVAPTSAYTGMKNEQYWLR